MGLFSDDTKSAEADAKRDAASDKAAGGPGRGRTGKPYRSGSDAETKAYDKTYRENTPKSWWW